MSSNSVGVELGLANFAAGLASREPAPGGGCAAAYLAAMGAGLASMAFRCTTGETFAEVSPYMEGRADELDALRTRALELVVADAEAIEAVRAPGTRDDAETEQKAARAALEAPLESMEVAVAALRLVAVGASRVNPELASNLSVATASLRAAVDGGHALTRDNADRVSDEAWTRRRTSAADALQKEARALGEGLATLSD